MSFMECMKDKTMARPDLGRAMVLYAKRLARMEVLKRIKDRNPYKEAIGHIITCEESLVEMAKSKAMEAVHASFTTNEQAMDLVKFLASEFVVSHNLSNEETMDSISSIMELEISVLFERIL